MRLASYDPNWPREFEVERDRLASGLLELALRIDHVGSTAVPRLVAKPVIDIQISVAQLLPIAAYAPLLARLGYKHVSHPGDAFCPFFHQPGSWPHTHHVHVVQSGGDEERRTLAFRDYLRENAWAAAEYGELKLRLARQFNEAVSADREAYSDAKGEFISRITELALRSADGETYGVARRR